jgi:alkylhydroperoxidase family enzyme
VPASDASREPRIRPVEKPDNDQRELLAKTLPGPDGRALNVFSTLAHHPRLLRRVNALGGLFMAHGGFDPREREIVILRTAFRSGSEYEWTTHVPIGRSAGLTDAEIERLRRPDAGTADPLVAAVDELHEDGEVGDATWRALGRRYDSGRLLELLFLIGFYRMLAGYLRTVRVETEPS